MNQSEKQKLAEEVLKKLEYDCPDRWVYGMDSYREDIKNVILEALDKFEKSAQFEIAKLVQKSLDVRNQTIDECLALIQREGIMVSEVRDIEKKIKSLKSSERRNK